MIDKNLFYSFDRIMSYNSVYNFIVGGRGIGKTYGAKTKAVENYLKRGEEFIYLRRYKEDLRTRMTWFADISHQWPEYGFRVNGMEAQMTRNPDDKKPTWETMGYFISLSNAQNKKSVAYPKVTWIIFDEFIIETGVNHYLKGEARVMLDFYSTVDRYQDRVRVMFLANSVSIMNPYFIEYKIEPSGKEFMTRENGFIACHFPNDAEFANAVKQTRFGRFIAGTDYEQYSVNNDFRDNSANLIKPKPSTALYAFTLETADGVFSIWRDSEADERGKYNWYAQTKRPKVETLCTLLPDRVSEDKRLLFYGDALLSVLRTSFRQGRVLFSSPTARNAFSQIFKR